MAITPEQQAMNNMAGIQLSMPQSVQKVTKKSWASQGTQYDPEKMQALRDALGLPRPKMTWQEALANSLAQTQNPQAFTGGFGEQFIDPWGTGFASLARGFGSTYGVRAANAREVAEKEREDAIKMAELENEAAKRTVSNQTADDYIKFNNPNGSGMMPDQQQTQRDAALSALRDLEDLSKGGIGGWNNEADSRWNSKKTASTLGRREQALSALLPMTNNIARASGGSGINTLGEMMAYLGIPENATSAQIKGALPGIVKKLGMEEEFYQRSPINSSNAKPVVIDGYTILPE